MKALIPVVALTVLVSTGCATKKFVRQTTDPIQAQVNELETKTSKQGEVLDKAVQDIETNKTEIGVAKEAATVANNRAGEADSKATTAGQKADVNAREIAALADAVNKDSFKVANQGYVLFRLNSDVLTKDAQAKVDELVASTPEGRFFVSVEGFADPSGDAEYNLDLSRRRANRVVHYLVTQHNIPVHRIFTLGLGEGQGDRMIAAEAELTARSERAEQRRVEVKIYTAEPVAASAQSQQQRPQQQPQTPQPPKQ
jgi:outer membrane protein OmpA-like peptidoglycan-associated protein